MFADELDRLAALHSSGKLSDDEYARAKARVLGDGGAALSIPPAVNGLRRSRNERWFGGVCGGLSRSTSLEPWAWRLLFVAAAFVGGCGVLAYLLLWIFVPLE